MSSLIYVIGVLHKNVELHVFKGLSNHSFCYPGYYIWMKNVAWWQQTLSLFHSIIAAAWKKKIADNTWFSTKWPPVSHFQFESKSDWTKWTKNTVTGLALQVIILSTIVVMLENMIFTKMATSRPYWICWNCQCNNFWSIAIQLRHAMFFIFDNLGNPYMTLTV